MTKLCPRGKAAAKRKFSVYTSAYANAYASKICAGKIKDPSGTKRKDFKGPKPAGKAMGGRIGYGSGTGREGVKPKLPEFKDSKIVPIKKDGKMGYIRPKTAKPIEPKGTMKRRENKMGGGLMAATERLKRQGKMGGGMAMPRAMYGKGGGVCKKGINRQAIGKNS